MKEAHLKYIRATIRLAEKSREKGNHPFGALLVDAEGKLLLEAENTVVTEQDCTGHAETNLMRLASQKYHRNILANCTIYSSAEPCPMCSGAIYWGNVTQIVYGLSEKKLYSMIRGKEALYLPCREIFEKGLKMVNVIGPLLENEALKVHIGFWK